MKHTGKRIISLLLCAVLLLSMAACGSSSATVVELSADSIQADVQEYIATFIDANATITSFSQTQNSISATEIEVQCSAAYAGNTGNGSGVFVLTYMLSGNTWSLENCTVDLSDNVEQSTVSQENESPFSNLPDLAAMSQGSPSDEDPGETEPDTDPTAAPAATPAPAVTPAPVASTSSGSQGGVLAGYSLTEVGTFDNPPVGSLHNTQYAVVLAGNETVTLYGPNGPVGEFASCQELGDREFGYSIVEAVNATGDNCRGIINGAGEQILDCEAVWIKEISRSHRFVEVYYSTGQCTENDNYLLGLAEGLFGAGEKTYYTGYRKIFDLQAKAFVGNIEVHSTDPLSINANETMVLVNEDNTSTLYDASGNQITQTTANISLTETLAVFTMDGCTYVFDINGERFTTDEYLYPINGDGDYFSISKNEGESIVDGHNNVVLPDRIFYNIASCYNNVFSGRNADKTAFQLIDIDGNVLYEGADNPYLVSEFVNGWWDTSPSVGAKSVISLNGTIESSGDGHSTLTIHDSNGNYTILNTGETLALGSSATWLTYGMVYARDSSGKYTVYDLFTGTALTEAKYSDVLYSYGYVYALEGSTWHVFQVNKIFQ